MKALVVFVSTLVANSCANNEEELGKRIVSGKHATLETYPFLASFQFHNLITNQWHHHCGASLMAPDKSVKLATRGSTFDGTTCTIAGWGYTEDKSVHDSEVTAPMNVDQLVHTNITNIPNERCEEILWPVAHCPIQQTNMCFYEEKHTPGSRPGSCVGDSGGPALCGDNRDVLAGITSWGTRCGWDPSVYVRVSEYLDWIKQN